MTAIDPIAANDPRLVFALDAAGLPVEDLELPDRHFFAFRDSDTVIGFVGWEDAGDRAALFRSLVVLPAARGRGWGKVMTQWAMEQLAGRGVDEVWMLTTTADAFAVHLGFERVDRSAAPESIQRTRQFAGLCPSTAILLRKSLR